MKIAVDGRAAVWYRGTGIGTYTLQLLRNLLRLTKNISGLFPQDYPGFDVTNQGYVKETIFKDKFWETIENKVFQVPKNTSILHIPHNGLGAYDTKAKRIVTLHDVIPYVLPDTVGVYYHKKFLLKMPKILREAERIITVSQHSKKDICNYLNVAEAKVDVVYEAPESIYKPYNRAKAKKYLAAKYNIDFPYILYLGGFSPRKNVPLLIEAFHKVHANLGKGVKLVIIGKMARNYEVVLNMIEKYKLSREVVFTGFIPVSDMPAVYTASDMFVYPSLYEGFGLPPLEAMACGVPTICSNNSSLPEVVGDGAELVDAQNLDTIAETILKISDDQEYGRKLAARGLVRAKEFSWHKTALETVECYKKVLRTF